MELFFIIASIVVIIITINISLNIEVSYNLYKNIGDIKIKLFALTIFKAQISLIAGYFNLIKKNKKVIQIKLDLNDVNFKFIGDVGEYFTKKIYFSNISTKFKLYGTDPLKIAILSGNILVIEGIARSYISVKSPYTTISSDLEVGYVDNYIKYKIQVGLLITIFDFIWAILRALVKRSMYGKKSKFRRKC